MKKMSLAISMIALLTSVSSAFASIKVDGQPEQAYNGKDYVATIVAANYKASDNGEQKIQIVTLGDNKNNESSLKSLTIDADGNDYPFGLTLANSVGKKIAVTFLNSRYDIEFVQIITDAYWMGAVKGNNSN